MTIKEKFERIDQSKLLKNQVDALKIVVDFTDDFKTTDQEKIKITNDKLDNIIKKLEEKNPEALKPISTSKSQAKKPKRNVFSVAKEIQKEDESFDDAKKRATQQIKDEKDSASKTVKSEMKSLLEYIKKHKELEGIHGTDLGRDSVRVAKIGGRRISKNGKIYYENRENRKDRLAPNYPKDAPLLEYGGGIHGADLAGNWGGGAHIDPANLSGTTGMKYSGLIGETGAMSAGEMFKKGGSLDYKYLNHSENYEVDYAKGKNRRGYGNVKYDKGGQADWAEKRKKYLEKLGNLESKVWDKINANSGAEIRGDKNLLKKYAENVEELMQKNNVGRGSFDENDYEYYVDENWHLFNEFLVWNNYYDPEFTKKEKLWRKERFQKDPKNVHISNPEIITLNESKVKSTNSEHYEIGDVVWQKDEKIYGVVLNNYGDPVNGDRGEIRLDSTGNTNIHTYGKNSIITGINLVKYGGNKDKGNGNIQSLKDGANRLIQSRTDAGDIESANYYIKVYKRLLQGEFDGKSAKNSKKYVPNYDIASITVNETGKETTITEGFLNGANELKKGGDLTKIARYIPKRNIISVNLKNGDKIKPSNGYWIKKKTPKMAMTQFEEETYEYNEGGKVEEIVINKDGIKVKSVAMPAKKLSEAEWIAKYNDSNEARSYKVGGNLQNLSRFIQDAFPDAKREANKYSKKYRQNYLVYVEKDEDDRINVGLADNFYKFPKSWQDAHTVLYITPIKLKNGGQLSFSEKAEAIAKKFEGKKVEPKYQNEYGKNYDEKEALEVGKKITGSQKKEYDFKYSTGGLLEKKERYILEIKGLTGLRKEAIENYIKDNNLTDDEILNIVVGLGRKQLKSLDVVTAITGRKSNKYSKNLLLFVSKNEAMKLINGSVIKKNAGSPNMKKAVEIAKSTRKSGETWSEALKRAWSQLK